MNIAGVRKPDESTIESIFVTVPLTGEDTFALTKPPAFASNCPTSTLSPFSTTGTAGAPICCASSTVAFFGSGQSTIGLCAENSL